MTCVPVFFFFQMALQVKWFLNGLFSCAWLLPHMLRWLGLMLHVNSCYLGKMPDVNYSEVDFVNCTQDTLPGGRFILRSTRGVCAGWQTVRWALAWRIRKQTNKRQPWHFLWTHATIKAFSNGPGYASTLIIIRKVWNTHLVVGKMTWRIQNISWAVNTQYLK